MMLKSKFAFFQKIILLITICLLFVFDNSIFALRDNEFLERTIRQTEIIHVMLEPDADENTVLNYIKTHINPNFNGSVSNISSYNAKKEGSIHWNIKDEEEILAIYFDGGTRYKRDHNYDFVDLRWLGNDSPHMYCFWKIKDVDVLQHHDILKAIHAQDNPALKLTLKISGKISGIEKLIKKIAIEKIMKKIAQKVSKKAIEKMPLGKFVIAGTAGVATEKLVDVVVDILEENPAALEKASSFISFVEDGMMNVTAVVDDIPVAREIARGGLEAWETYQKAKSYPVNVFNEVGKNLFKQDNYKKVNDPLDFANNVGTGTALVFKSVGNATINTAKDIGYGTYDTATKFFPFLKKFF
ncbi:MAG: hypothetical protein ACLTFB_01705 [Candidatus Phytoplasma pyri]